MKEKNSINYVEVNKMIKEITTGNLGNVSKQKKRKFWSSEDIDEMYSYVNNKILIYYNIKMLNSNNTKHYSYSVYYKGSLMYKNEDNIILCSNYNHIWVNELFVTYKYHLNELKTKENIIQKEQQDKLKKEKIKRIFSLVNSNGYIDSKIMIDNIEHYRIPAPASANSKNEDIYNGRIMFLDGTIVVDTRQDIYHPGHWEDYVCYLVDVLELRKKYEQQLSEYKYDNHKKQDLERQRLYELNHAPIDDIKHFR